MSSPPLDPWLANFEVSGIQSSEIPITDSSEEVSLKLEHVFRIQPSTLPRNPLTGDIYLDKETSQFRIYIHSKWYKFELSPVDKVEEKNSTNRFEEILSEIEDE